MSKAKRQKYRQFAWLNEKHNIEKLSIRKISEISGISRGVISRWMDELDVPKRTPIEGAALFLSTTKRSPEHIEMLKSQIGDKHPKWKGGKFKDQKGYVRIRTRNHPKEQCNGHVFEHRLVMEQAVGRVLEDNEVVHHINGTVDDNRPENLFLFYSSKDHLYFHYVSRRDKNFPLKYKYDELH